MNEKRGTSTKQQAQLNRDIAFCSAFVRKGIHPLKQNKRIRIGRFRAIDFPMLHEDFIVFSLK